MEDAEICESPVIWLREDDSELCLALVSGDDTLARLNIAGRFPNVPEECSIEENDWVMLCDLETDRCSCEDGTGAAVTGGSDVPTGALDTYDIEVRGSEIALLKIEEFSRIDEDIGREFELNICDFMNTDEVAEGLARGTDELNNPVAKDSGEGDELTL